MSDAAAINIVSLSSSLNMNMSFYGLNENTLLGNLGKHPYCTWSGLDV